MSSSKPSVLVVLATGKLGSGVCDAFLATNKLDVFGTSRNPNHPTLVAKGVTPIGFRFGDKDSMLNALKVSKATVAVLITDLIHIAKSRETEIHQCKILIDACKQAGTRHVILCSTGITETAPETANHLKSKVHCENYLKAAGLPCYSIVRSHSFFENYDDAVNHNPLQRGRLSDLYPGNAKVAFTATLDVGKAAVAMANNRNQWNGKTLDCLACMATGEENAKILSQVSGVPCTYKVAVPSFVLWLILGDLYYMVQYIKDGMPGYDGDGAEFKKVVPDAMGPKEWFQAKGQWADGSKFNEPPPPPKHFHWSGLAVVGVLGVILSVVVKGYGIKS